MHIMRVLFSKKIEERFCLVGSHLSQKWEKDVLMVSVFTFQPVYQIMMAVIRVLW